jgi:hypothetical protein
MTEPIAESMKRFNEQVAKPWAEEMQKRFKALGRDVARMRVETQAKPCPCGCGHTIGEACGGGMVNLHVLLRGLGQGTRTDLKENR